MRTCMCDNCWVCLNEAGPAQYAAQSAKPPARSHIKGCVLDSDHKEGCYVELPAARPCPHGNVGCGTTRICEVCKGERRPNLSPFRQDSDDLKSPALSPRQALGEALACVERARDLLRGAATSPEMVGFETRAALFRAHEDANALWCNLTLARALLAQEEPK